MRMPRRDSNSQGKGLSRDTGAPALSGHSGIANLPKRSMRIPHRSSFSPCGTADSKWRAHGESNPDYRIDNPESSPLNDEPKNGPLVTHYVLSDFVASCLSATPSTDGDQPRLPSAFHRQCTTPEPHCQVAPVRFMLLCGSLIGLIGSCPENGCIAWIRTGNLTVNSRLLYRLSYYATMDLVFSKSEKERAAEFLSSRSFLSWFGDALHGAGF